MATSNARQWYRFMDRILLENRMVQEYSALLSPGAGTEGYRIGGIRHYATEAQNADATRDGDASSWHGNLQHRAGGPSTRPQRALYPQCDPEGRPQGTEGRQGVSDHQGSRARVLREFAGSDEGEVERSLKHHSASSKKLATTSSVFVTFGEG
jgi:hypothetical protein